jgi:N-acetylglutamate synthase
LNITHLEELSLNAWPALTTLASDGWLLRLANGYTRRANSVNPLYAGTQSIGDKLAAAEALYRGRGQDVVFKLTPAAQPPELDDHLAARGYSLEAPTSVQALPLGGGALAAPGTATVAEALTDTWAEAYTALGQVNLRHHATLRQMLSSLVPRHGFFLQRAAEGQPLACGLAVIEAGHVGLFDIVTHPAHRQQGHARRLIADMVAWAQAHGAHTAYLQVMLNNAPALKLYDGLGFGEVYRYWYRLKG